MSERPQISRRRLLVGTGTGAAALWAAPAITTLGGAHAAGSDCSVFLFVSENLPAPGPSYAGSTALTGSFSAPGTLTVGVGNVDLVGPGAYWDPGYTPVLSMDLTGTAPTDNATVTELNGPSLVAGSYRVELEVWGAVSASPNTVTVIIGGTTILPVSVGPTGPTTSVQLNSSSVNASGQIQLRHVSHSADQQGMFLKRLEIFSEYC